MHIISPSPGILETAVSDEDLLKTDTSSHASHDKDGIAVSKQVMKAYRRAKKVSEVENIRSRRICAEMRSKREGTDHPFDTVIIEEPALKVQTLLSDF